jgi:hypothetical protein
MNPLKKLQRYFIGGALAKTDDVFEQAKAEVLFNFTFFFLLSNLPYLFVGLDQFVHFAMGASTILALLLVLIVIKRTNNIKYATYFFLVNFTIQDFGHYFINNGRMAEQGMLFSLLFILCGFLLLDRKWGTGIGIFTVAIVILGIYNQNNDFVVWKVPPEISDPQEIGGLKYLAIIPMFLNAYLISEFVKARQKAEKQISEQKTLVEEKQKEILDSIRYAKRIQNSQLPPISYIEKELNRLKKEK